MADAEASRRRTGEEATPAAAPEQAREAERPRGPGGGAGGPKEAGEGAKMKAIVKGKDGKEGSGGKAGASSSSTAFSWSEMYSTASSYAHSVHGDDAPALPISSYSPTCGDAHDASSFRCNNPNHGEFRSSNPANVVLTLQKSNTIHLALYIAMAHAGLILMILIIYGMVLLLKDFWNPILWSVLCSIPLRQIQNSLYSFFHHELKSGLFSTMLSPFKALCMAVVQTVLDLTSFLSSLRGKSSTEGKAGFARLLRWLITIAIAILLQEFSNPVVLSLIVVVGTSTYALRYSRFRSDSNSRSGANERSGLKQNWMNSIKVLAYPFKVIDGWMCAKIISNLKTIIAIFLIFGFLFNALCISAFFSYKIAIEGKDAVLDLDSRVRNSNYAEKIGLNKLLNDSNAFGIVEHYTSVISDRVWNQIDGLAEQYGVSDVAAAAKTYIENFSVRKNFNQSSFRFNQTRLENATGLISVTDNKLFQTLSNVHSCVSKYDLKGAYAELQSSVYYAMEKFNINPEIAKERIKNELTRLMSLLKGLLFTGKSALFQSVSFFNSIVVAISHGAMEILEFITQAALFFSLLYYLITSETGGIIEQIMHLIPVSSPAKQRCVVVLNEAISSVMLSVVQTATFNAIFTFLVLHVFNIHFIFMSTFLSFFCAIFPIIPMWTLSLFGVLELWIEGSWVLSTLLFIVHQVGLSYGNDEIVGEISGYNPYITGLSIGGGIALFNSVGKGAILGPLMATVLIALKNLYAEFVLSLEK